ncbi:MAG TPA: type II toxin-antitoxin system VapC family toxin [Thalassobaculum sp.]
MDLLLDTHVVIWWNDGGDRLSGPVRAILADPRNRIFVSAATPWEIAIKTRKGRFAFRGPLDRLIEGNGFRPLPIAPAHGILAGSLDWAHADPFDRVIVAQALSEQLVLVHADRAIRDFDGIGQLWAA